MANVVLDIQMLIHHPHRIGQIKRHMQQLALKDRRQMHPALNVLADIGSEVALVLGRQLINAQTPNMQRGFRRFDVQKQCVQSAQMIHTISDVVGWICKRLRSPAGRTNSELKRANMPLVKRGFWGGKVDAEIRAQPRVYGARSFC